MLNYKHNAYCTVCEGMWCKFKNVEIKHSPNRDIVSHYFVESRSNRLICS